MKKLNTKLLAIGLTVLFFSVALIILVRAQEGEQPFFRVNSASTTPAGAKMPTTNPDMPERIIKIINRSSKDYFVPRKTLREFESFVFNAPKYVAVSVCGDGICNQKLVCTTTPRTITVDAATKNKIFDKTTFLYWPYSQVVQPAINNALYFLGETERANFCASSQHTTNVLKCENVGSESRETCPDDCLQTVSSNYYRPIQPLQA